MNKKLCILASPTSGTHYMAALMCLYGLKIKHECMGEDGISDWRTVFSIVEKRHNILNTLMDSYPWKDVVYNTVIRITRNPWNVISTWIQWYRDIKHNDTAYVHFSYGLGEICHKFFGFKIDNPWIESSVLFMLWQMMIDECKYDFTFKVESKDFFELSKFLLERGLIESVPSNDALEVPIEQRNQSKYVNRISEEEIKDNIPHTIYVQIKKYADRFGY